MIFLDRSGWETYHQRCAYRYYLERLAGPTRHGIAPAFGETPLLTGTLVHAPIAAINREWLRQCDGRDVRPELAPRWDDRALDAALNEGLAEAREEYLAVARQSSLDRTKDLTAEQCADLGLPAPDARVSDEDRAREQLALVEGLAWIYRRYVLPDLMQRGRPIWVEQEATILLGGTCTCGRQDDHDWRNHGEWWEDAPGAAPRFTTTCRGVFFSATPDLLIQRFSDHRLEYHELKTQASEGRAESWQYKPQFLSGARSVEPYLLDTVDTYYVHLLLKGDLKGEWNPEQGDYSGPKRQQSCLCYVYQRDPVPGIQDADWQPFYEWREADGAKRRLGKSYRKVPIWTCPFSAREWVELVGPERLSKCYRLIGPLGRQVWMEEPWMAQLTDWGRTLHDAMEALGVLHDDPRIEAQITAEDTLLQTFPRSWDCFPFAEQVCPFLPVCTRQAGWQAPWELDRYRFRRPHHHAEFEAGVAMGWFAPEGEGEPTS